MIILKIASPIIFIVGIFSNLLSFIIFTDGKMKHLPTFKFLSYLSLIDCLYILIGMPHIMAITYGNYDFRNTSDLVCSIHSFLTIYLSHLSSNVLAAIGVFRCVEIITFKSASKAVSESKRSHINKKDTNIIYSSNKTTLYESVTKNFGKIEVIILSIMSILFIFNCHYLLFMRLRVDVYQSNSNVSKNYACYPTLEADVTYFEFYTIIWPWIDLFLYSYIPFTVMVTSTIIIIYKLCKANRRLKKRYKTEVKKDEKTEVFLKKYTIIRKAHRVKVDNKIIFEAAKRRAKRNNQVYKLLLMLNATFFILVTPIVLSNSLKFLDSRNQAILEIVYLLAYLNHCLNFIFYGLTCELFRMVLFKKLRVLSSWS